MQSNDRRKTFRCPVTVQQQSAVLIVGTARIKARIIDESASGFALLLDEAPDVESHPVLRLLTPSGVSRVNVIEVQAEDGAYRIGLRRIHDLPEGKPEICSLPRFRRNRDPHEIAAPLPKFGLGLAALGSIVLLLVAWKVLFGDGIRSADASSSPPIPFRSTDKTARPAVQPKPVNRRADGVPAAAVFTLPLVADQLQLSEAQQARINAITQRNLSLESAPENDEAAQSASRQPLDETLDEALAVLTEEQRQQWAAILGARQQ